MKKETKPWWDDVRWPELSRGTLDHHWIHQALIEQCVKDPSLPPVQFMEVEGICSVSFEELDARLREQGLRAVKSRPPKLFDPPSSHAIYTSEACGVDIYLSYNDKDVQFSAATWDVVRFDRLRNLAKEVIKPYSKVGRVFALIQQQTGVSLQSVGLAGMTLEVGNYTPEVIEDYRHIVKDLNSKDPCGRIIILDGAPGTGKSTMIRAILTDVKATFVVIPSSMVSSLDGPNLLGPLIANKPADKSALVLLVEDADDCLVSRGADNMAAISSLLNLSDGILGATLNIRILATTNSGSIKGTEEMDEAILRPGRLCRRIHVPELDAKRAEGVYTRLTGKSLKFEGKVTLAEIYRLARDSGWVPKEKAKPMGFVAPDRAVEGDRVGLDKLDREINKLIEEIEAENRLVEEIEGRMEDLENDHE